MAKEKKIVISTHGQLASGIVSALEIIVGNTEGIETICGYLTPDFNLANEIEQLMANIDFDKTELIVCTDMMGGSVNNEFMKYLGKYDFHLVTNIHLALMIDLLLSPEINASILNEKMEDDLLKVKYVNGLMNQFDMDTDEL